jgi:hypothetical protein
MSSYSLRVTNESASEVVVAAHGSLGLVTYASKEALAELTAYPEGTEFRAHLAETETVEGQEVRTVTSISGDADDVTAVLKRKIAKERKQNAAASTEITGTPTEPTEAERETESY